MSTKGSGQSFSIDGRSSLGSPCDLGPCAPWLFRGGVSPMYSYDGQGAGWGAGQGGGSLSYQQYLTDDKSRFEAARKEACQDKWTSAAETSSVGAATVAVCATIETGLGAVGCAAGIVSYGIGLYKTNQAANKCLATYPGPGKW